MESCLVCPCFSRCIQRFISTKCGRATTALVGQLCSARTRHPLWAKDRIRVSAGPSYGPPMVVAASSVRQLVKRRLPFPGCAASRYGVVVDHSAPTTLQPSTHPACARCDPPQLQFPPATQTRCSGPKILLKRSPLTPHSASGPFSPSLIAHQLRTSIVAFVCAFGSGSSGHHPCCCPSHEPHVVRSGGHRVLRRA